MIREEGYKNVTSDDIKVFANDPKEILNYTKEVYYIDNSQEEFKDFLKANINHSNDSEFRAWTNSLMYMSNVLDDNEITRYCFSNVVLKFDHNENCKPTKLENQQKIDGVIAMIQSLGIMIQEPQYNQQILAVV